MDSNDLELLKNFTILYVEDDRDTVDSIGYILNNYFKKVYIAYNGIEGLEIYNRMQPDIILSDIQMPKMNGIEMAKNIKNINKEQNIIFFTAFNDNKFLQEALNIGISKYVSKPFVKKQFFDSLLSVARVLQLNIDKKRVENILEVQSKTSAVGEMIGNIAHQWRQPLSVITALVSSILASLELDDEISKEELEKHMYEINHQAQYLSTTIDDFRDFLRDDNSNIKNINLKDALEYTCSIVESSLKDNFINYISDLDDIEILGNKNHLSQVFINICNNSKDAMVEQNSIYNRYLFVTSKEVDNQAVITLRDSGGGIDEDIIERIFEPYFTTKHQSVGTGIGLYISFKTVTKHYKGTIEAKNVEYRYNGVDYKGAEFVISLPLNKFRE